MSATMNSGNNLDMQGLDGLASLTATAGICRGAGTECDGASFAGPHRHSRHAPRLLLVWWLATIATPSPAHPLSLQECFEGGDFIAHAAQARDNGITKAAFSDKLVADIYLIQGFPPELRWFVQDPDDAEFLLAESTRVFDQPKAPEAHRTAFLARCFDRKLGTDGLPPVGRNE